MDEPKATKLRVKSGSFEIEFRGTEAFLRSDVPRLVKTVTDLRNVEITAAEPLGIGTRGAYYEEAGALRDMVANHLLQLLALTAMEPPVAIDADSVREEKAQVWRSIRPMTQEAVREKTVRGQYGPGEINVPLACGNTVVLPGDIVVGDTQGVAVIPQADAEEVLRLVIALKDREANVEKTID